MAARGYYTSMKYMLRRRKECTSQSVKRTSFVGVSYSDYSMAGETETPRVFLIIRIISKLAR
jgi:hypothetical protein